MKKLNSIIILLFLFSLAANGCSSEDSTYNSINVDQLKKEIKENPNMIILDVRTPEELAGPLGHIDGVINIPLQNLEDRITELDKYKDKKINVICRSGNRSGKASAILFEKGFNVSNVEGGMKAYRQSDK